MKPKALIADDEPELREGLRLALQSKGFDTEEVADGESALQKSENQVHDLILLDVRMPLKSGLEVLEKIKLNNPKAFIVLITAHANVKDAVHAMQMGAFDYIEKPLKKERLFELVDAALHARDLREKASLSLPKEVPGHSPDFVGASKSMLKVFDLINRLAHVNTTVLIRGENGTGKELVARAIHAQSSRRSQPFVAINCGAIPEALMESEFFGHEKGSFTGAEQRKIGKFQFASGGTLFLDEVAELPTNMQVKLLRVLQDQRITPVGSNRDFPVEVRIIAATNQNLEKMMKENTFRSDLFYRLNVMPVFLPPLRERKEDIPALADHFVQSFNTKHNREIQHIDPMALKQLTDYPWPGNIRELENAIEHAFVLEQSSTLQETSLPEHIRETILDNEEGWHLPFESNGHSTHIDFRSAKENFEKEFIIQALKQNNGRINQTCEKSGIPKNTLLRKIQKYGIQPSEYTHD